MWGGGGVRLDSVCVCVCERDREGEGTTHMVVCMCKREYLCMSVCLIITA